MKAVVLFNLGGPKNLEDVKPFLFNLFYDRAILSLPNPFRYLLAKFISSTRTKKATHIYSSIGGGSPIVKETQKQAEALKKLLGSEYEVFICMRYWKPSIHEVIQEIKGKDYSDITLMPLYPQYSFSTTGSFMNEWNHIAKSSNLDVPTKTICCYPQETAYIDAVSHRIQETIQSLGIPDHARYLFSAHGLPLKSIKQGDPYEKHVKISVKSIVQNMPAIKDYRICYQSKVGPLEWLGPSTEQEIEQAAKENVPVVIVPISFVSENSETLYELDIQYKELANDLGLKGYFRVPTIDDSLEYINLLSDLILLGKDKICTKATCGQNCLSSKDVKIAC